MEEAEICETMKDFSLRELVSRVGWFWSFLFSFKMLRLIPTINAYVSTERS